MRPDECFCRICEALASMTDDSPAGFLELCSQARIIRTKTGGVTTARFAQEDDLPYFDKVIVR